MSTVHVFTSAATNYLPKVRVLFDSVRRFHPTWRLHLCLPDARPPADVLAAAGADEVHTLEDLGIPEWRAWTFCHSIIELATAVKPFCLAKLLARDDCDAAIYLDPDIVVFSPLTDVLDGLERADIVLTPHQTRPDPTTYGVIANEICTLQHGVYNLGFIGVARRGDGPAFAAWWRERTYRFCRIDLASGLFTDQRWIDLVPAFFERVEALRSPRLNVAPWNLSTRDVAGKAPDGVTVDGRPVGFFHFSAVDRAAVFGGFAANRAVADLVAWYRKQTKPNRVEKRAPQGWAFDTFADGSPILREQRLVYRLRGDLQRAFPDPFASGPGAFQAWWAANAPLEYAALYDAQGRAAEMARLESALMTGHVDL